MIVSLGNRFEPKALENGVPIESNFATCSYHREMKGCAADTERETFELNQLVHYSFSRTTMGLQ